MYGFSFLQPAAISQISMPGTNALFKRAAGTVRALAHPFLGPLRPCCLVLDSQLLQGARKAVLAG